jgi:raffinose/stachyose/melibiose transport system substrate-binding protein
MRRIYVAAAFLVCLSLSVVWAGGTQESKSSPAAPAASAPQPITLTFLNHNTEKPERIAFFSDVAKKYSQLHPNVTINITNTSFTDVNTQVLTAINAGSPYDVFTAYSQQLWVDKGIVLDISKYLNANNAAWKNRIYPEVLQAITYPDGSVYMIPLWIDTSPLLYNKAIFSKEGLSIPTTKDQFYSVADKLKDAGYIPMEIHGSMTNDYLTVIAWQFAAKYGVSPYDIVRGKVPFTDPWFTDALTLLKQMYDKGYLPKNFWSIGGTDGRMLYSTGKTATRLGFFWDVDTQKDMGMPYENQAVAPVPNFTGDPSVKVYETVNLTGLMIYKDTKVADAAADFVQFMTNSDNQSDMSYKYFGREPNGMTPIDKSVPLSDYAKQYFAALAQGVSTPYLVSDVALKAQDLISSQIPLLMQGSKTVQQVAAAFEALRQQQ